MLQEIWGDDQTIDLKQWAMCLGLRQEYLDTWPDRRWAGHLVILNAQRAPAEILRLTLENNQVRLRFLPPRVLPLIGAPGPDMAALAARIAAASPPNPPVLFTIVMDEQAAGEFWLAVVSDPQRSQIFRNRLAEGYGRHWAVHAVTEIGQDLVQWILKNDLRTRLSDWIARSEGQTIILHRDGVPATRGGVRLQNGQFVMLSPEDLISVPGATWVDERFIGESLDLLDRMLRQTTRRNPLALYGELGNLLKRNYVRLPDGKPIPWMRWLPTLLKGKWFSSSPPTPTIAPPPARMTLALYIESADRGEMENASCVAHAQEIMRLLERHPQVKVTWGWTAGELESLTEPTRTALQAGIAREQWEIVCVAGMLPLPLLPAPDAIESQMAWWSDLAQNASIQAAGIEPPGGRLSAGWAERLRKFSYQYAIIDESVLRRWHANPDLTRPLLVEGIAAIGLSRELGQVLGQDIAADVQRDYLSYLAAGHADKTLAARVRLDTEQDWRRFESWLNRIKEMGFSTIPLSGLSRAYAQGAVNLPFETLDLEAWTHSEAHRRRNAQIEQLWGRWQDIRALVEQTAGSEPGPAQAQTLQQAARRTLSAVAAPSADLATAENDLIRQSLLSLGAMPTLPERALGVLRVFDPRRLERRGCLLTVQVPWSGRVPTNLSFIDQGVTVPMQKLDVQNDTLSLLLAVDLDTDDWKDLILRPDVVSPAIEGLDVTTGRLCNPWLAVLLDRRGQITSLRYQGQEWLCGSGNLVSGYLLSSGQWLRPDLNDAEISVTSAGRLLGSIVIRQTLAGGIQLTRHLHLSLLAPLLECVTELDFATPTTLGGPLIVGQFDLAGSHTSWPLPLQAGIHSCQVAETPLLVLSMQDTVDVHTGWAGLRYITHRPTTRTGYYAARPLSNGLRLGLVVSRPPRQADPTRLGAQPGIGFPGHTYHGRYTYRYALLPLAADTDARTEAYQHPPLWAFYKTG